MSKISRIRIVNLNYNHDSINVDDKTFDLGGESTLISLRNGGGKSVLVQMIVSLFVHKTYRDFGDREFKNYFNTNKPTFLITEWQLDNNSDRFLAGMMVRKNQRDDNDVEELELLTFTGSYDKGCSYDLDHIPIVKVSGNNKILKSFGECKSILEGISKEKDGDFKLYDMSSSYGRSQYFKTLKQYQINNKEWESIIRKVNQKESGLSDLFQNAKDEKNLVENWFLKPIEDKLNVEKNKIDEFRNLTFKFIEQYRSNQSNIARKEIIEKYFEDTVSLKEDIDSYVARSEEKKESTAQMVLYIKKLGQTIQNIVESILKTEEELTTISTHMKRITYEQISNEIYKKRDEKQEVDEKRIQQELEIISYKNFIETRKRQLNIYDCSRIYGELKDMKCEKAEVDEKINLLVADSQGTKEEIEAMGEKLYLFYNNEVHKISERLEEEQGKHTATSQSIEKARLEKSGLDKTMQELSVSIGKLQQAVKSYDEVEDTFNETYHCQLNRNIVALYPEGFLEVKSKEMEEESQEERSKLARLSRKKSDLEVELKNLLQEENGNMISITEGEHKIKDLNKELAKLEGEKQERLKIIKYAGMKESDLDNRVLILDSLERKLKELDMEKADIITEKADLEKQHRQLKEGKTMELPANIQEYFHDNGIEAYYGMEWLTKNGRSVKDNTALVAKNPFIPYAIIMEKDVFERFKNTEKELYTSFPIPIIIRGDLEKSMEDMQGHITTYGNVHFFIMFNNHLLDKEQLLEMLSQLEKRIAALEKQLGDKTADINTFGEYRVTIEKQSYATSLYESVQKDIQNAKQVREKLQLRQQDIKEEKDAIQKKQKENNHNIDNSKEVIRLYEERKRAFEKLCQKYASYETDRTTLQREEREREECSKKQKELEHTMEELAGTLEGLKASIRQYENSITHLQQQASLYEMFADNKQEVALITDSEEATKLEARYKALTQKVSEAMEELKRRQEKLAETIRKKQYELVRKNKNDLLEEEYSNVSFTEEQYDDLESQISKEEKELNAALEQTNKYQNQIGRLEENIKNLKANLLKETGEEEPVPREIIVDTEFEKRIRLERHQETVARNNLKAFQNRKSELSSLASGVAEFSEDKIEVSEENLAEIATNIPDIVQMDHQTLEKYQREIKKKLRDIDGALTHERTNIYEKIREISSKEEYSEDYFAKTFANLLSQAGDPYNLARQFQVNKAAYENQLEKLKVDLENIDKERKNIEEMFLEYVQSINANIAMIDKNSTITVRNRNIKMLRIQVPDWDSEREHFKMRLHDFFDLVIKYGLETIANNKNLGEYLGNAISTRKLYDDVVGIQNVKIKLYKIEAEREVPITWAEVSANSGGEGFLSAFVILTCLLSYMRRDESDMFTTGEEGKVLIMDNPFAQTYSAHLLKPLMEMAKKTNTQLICLSGLGGDSIYNRFDNIYVVKLVDSNIRNGVQRLESKHIKGNEVKKMVLSDFKTQQIGLFDMVEE